MPEPTDFRTLLNRLSDEKVEFIIVGGIAMVHLKELEELKKRTRP